MKRLIVLLASVAIASLSAAPIVVTPEPSGAAFALATTPAQFVARGRYGNNLNPGGQTGTMEYGVGSTGVAAVSNSQGYNLVWPNNQALSFSLGYDSVSGATTFSIQSGSGISSYTAPTGGFGLLGLNIRARANQTVTLRGLTVDNGANSALVSFTGAPGAENAYYYLTAPEFGGSFTLDGVVVFNYSGTSTANERPAFDFIAAGEPSGVPEPSTYGLIGAGLAALVMIRRKLT